MKKIIFTCLPLISTFAFAGTEPLKKQIPVEAAIGKYQIDMDFGVDRPMTESIHMDVSILCNDQRSKPNSAKPQLEKLVEDEKICAFDDYKFDKETKVLTVKYSTGQFGKDDMPSCDNHWSQEIDTKEVCQMWSTEGARTPANEDSEVAQGDTDFSARRRTHHRGVRARTSVPQNQYFNSSWSDNNPMFSSNSIFSGGMFTNSNSKYIGRDGKPRNHDREVSECPGMGLSACMSAIWAAETSCVMNKYHGNHGWGPCAVEADSRRFRFGEACHDYRSVSGHQRCCQAMIDQQGAKYFGARTRKIAGTACGWR